MYVHLKSGRTVYANKGIFGLDADLAVSQGYDGMIGWPQLAFDEPNPETGLITADMREIADMMIDRWRRFQASLPETT